MLDRYLVVKGPGDGMSSGGYSFRILRNYIAGKFLENSFQLHLAGKALFISSFLGSLPVPWPHLPSLSTFKLSLLSKPIWPTRGVS